MGVPGRVAPPHASSSAPRALRLPPHSIWRRPGPRLRSAQALELAHLTHATLVMADPRQDSGSGAPETCGLEQIVEALKLLLSPGGERTDLRAGPHPGLSGPPVFHGFPGSYTVCPQALAGPQALTAAPALGALGIVQPHTTVEETKAQGSVGFVEYCC